MIFDIVLIIIIFVCLSGIIFIIVKKLPLLAAINTDQFHQVKQDKTKNLILRERLKRKIMAMRQFVNLWLRNLIEKIKK